MGLEEAIDRLAQFEVHRPAMSRTLLCRRGSYVLTLRSPSRRL